MIDDKAAHSLTLSLQKKEVITKKVDFFVFMD